jgi:tRNA pseudouridine65 synthase
LSGAIDESAILYRDEHLVAVNKPAGLLVHRSGIADGAERFALQEVRDLLRRRVYSVHRLDRPASGVLVFGLSLEAGRRLSGLFEGRAVDKRYLGVVRGWPAAEGVIDDSLSDGAGQPARESRDAFPGACPGRGAGRRRPLSHQPLCPGGRPWPETGRYHQIRRHFHHVYHPLIGDTTHGEGRHNRFFRESLGVGAAAAARRLAAPQAPAERGGC